VLKVFQRVFLTSQSAHDVKTTSFGRCYDIKTVKLRRSNVVHVPAGFLASLYV